MKKSLIFTILLIVPIMGYLFIAFLLPFQIPVLPSSTIFLDKDGKEIGEIIYSGSIRHREITFEEIPEFTTRTLIALEDRTFYDNNGISIWWIGRSLVHNLQAGKVIEWGSTISAQLVRNILGISESRSFGRKLLEFMYAVRINHLLTKNQILTEYLNRVGFGYMNYGLKSASIYYFDKEPKNLTRAEQIALLSLPKDPRKYDPYKQPRQFRARFELLTKTLVATNILSNDESEAIRNEQFAWNRDHSNPLPYVSDFLNLTPTLSIHGEGDAIQTTFDRVLTQHVDEIAHNALRELAWRNVGDYGILIAERTENNPLLRVMIGWVSYRESTAGQVNTTTTLRQPGSTIKPFTYVLAFKNLGLTPEDTILDLPIAYKTSENYSYEPKNYTQDYKGEITLRRALSESINIPAVKLTERLWVSSLLEFLRSLGITSLTRDADHYGLALTLGDGEISLYELLQAYTIFTSNGQFCPFEITIPAKTCKQIIDSKYTDMINSILTDRYAKLGGFPLYSSLDFADRLVAVKTGTSRNFRDNWAIGFTPHYMIGVWTGNKSGENMKGVSGATGAGEIFRRIVYALEPTGQDPKPLSRVSKTQNSLTITSPLHESVYQKTADKSDEWQQIKLRFETNIPYDTAQWMLNGTKVTGDFIDLVPGRHTIEIILLKDGQIVEREKNSFSVEGA